MLLSPSVALFSMLYVDPSPLVSVAPPSFASGVDPLPFVIVADHPITDSERMITGLLLPFGVKIFAFDDWLNYLFTYWVFVVLIHLSCLIHLSFFWKECWNSREKHRMYHQKYRDSSPIFSCNWYYYFILWINKILFR